MFRTALEELARQRGITIHYLIGPRIPGRSSFLPQSGGRWRDTDVLHHLIPGLQQYDVFLCGPDAWMDAAAEAALAAGLPAEQLHQERFTW